MRKGAARGGSRMEVGVEGEGGGGWGEDTSSAVPLKNPLGVENI